MKEIKAYTDIARSICGDIDDSTSMTFIPSGFKGAWIVVFEDPAYNLHTRYLLDEEVKYFKLDKETSL